MYSLNFDGCCKGNPGKGAAGAVIYKNNIEIFSISIFVGEKTTNNVAEYTGLLIGLQEASKMGLKQLTVKGDSQLVIKQMKGEYQVKAPALVKLFQAAKQLQKQFTEITFAHVYRTENKRADELANQGLCPCDPLTSASAN